MQLRGAREDETDRLARLWHEAWHDAHGAILPPALCAIRTFDNFRERLHAQLPEVRVAELGGKAVGFHIVRGDELDQLFVAAPARGQGVAAALLADAEARMSAAGVADAWLACAIGNQRAARFYGKAGWRNAGAIHKSLPIPGGSFELQIWRFEKVLPAP
jgi:GNAT superfamily N-acetyltransferase